MYNDVLTLKIPHEANIIGFADDIAITVSARYSDEVELIANEVIVSIRKWMESVGLSLAEHKTEAVLITGRKKIENISIKVGKHMIMSKPYLKYLGVLIDARLNFKAHIDHICKKASNARMALERMMPNIGGPRQSKRKMIMSVASSMILYAAPVWVSSLKTKSVARKLKSANRLCAIRVCCSFRTVSEDAACILAGMIPLDILAEESKRMYDHKKRGCQNLRHVRKLERAESLRIWQDRWNLSSNGRWTFELISNIDRWLNRRYGEMNYHMTQFLSGHGSYRSFLYRFGLDESPLCPTCPNVVESPEHVMFNCPRFDEVRQKTQEVTGLQMNTHNIFETIVNSRLCWDGVCSMLKCIHETLRREEAMRKNSQINAIEDV